jgi:hypothetical protein
MIYGYAKNGAPTFIKDYDSNDGITDPYYINMNSVCHGDYSDYGAMFRFTAISNEKFAMQKNLLADLLKQLQENNDKTPKADMYLSTINKVRAQSAPQGENARVIMLADVIIFFKQKNINMPTEFFGNDAEMATDDNSNFNKCITFIGSNGGISNSFSYVAQGRLKSGEEASSNMMLADFSNRDLLELGSLNEIYEQTDDADANMNDVSRKVKRAGPVAGLVIAISFLAFVVIAQTVTIFTRGLGIALLAGIIALALPAIGAGVGLRCETHGNSVKFHATDNIVRGDEDNLLCTYWCNRNEAKKNDEMIQIKLTLKTYGQALINSIDNSYPPFRCSLEGVASNEKDSCDNRCDEPAANGFQLHGWAPASMGWGATGH